MSFGNAREIVEPKTVERFGNITHEESIGLARQSCSRVSSEFGSRGCCSSSRPVVVLSIDLHHGVVVFVSSGFQTVGDFRIDRLDTTVAVKQE